MKIIYLLIIAVLAGIGLVSFSGLNKSVSAVGVSSLLFDGTNDYLSGKNIPFSNTFTLEAWVKRTRDTGSYETIMSDANSAYSQAMVTVYIDGGSQDCGSGDMVAFYQLNGNQAQCANRSVGINEWHHIVVQRDSSGRRQIYIDGQLSSEQVNTLAPTDSNGVFSIGRAGSCNCEYFPGLVDEVHMSNISRYLNNFVPGTSMSPDQSTVFMYRLDEGSGQTVNDARNVAASAKRNGILGSTTAIQASDPLWSNDTPMLGGASPSPTPVVVLPTATPTAIPGLTPTAQPTPTRIPTPTRTPTPIPTISPSPTPIANGGGAGTALRFYGNGTGDIDRVRFAIDNPESKLDMGNGSFTMEAWIKPDSLSINQGSAVCSGSDGWINGNIVFDRDIFGPSDYGDFGLSIGDGRLVFGVAQGGSGVTVCGSTNIADGNWHHIAAVRDATNGQLRVYVDGVLDGTRTGAPTGDVSYRNGRSTSWPFDRYLVIGAEKHDYDYGSYPSYSGLLDEVRFSNSNRYSGNAFVRPNAPFVVDGSTLGLYHFNEGSGTTAIDSAVNPQNGVIRIGNGSRPSLPRGPVYETSSAPLN